MSIILGLETATERSSVALIDEGQLLFELSLHHGRDLSRILMSAVKSCFALVRREMKEITGVAVSAGPGSFTGLRIGVTAAKTLAFALSIPAAPVSTLEALAMGAVILDGQQILALIDARRGEFFAALFKASDGSVARLGADSLVKASDLACFADSQGEPGWDPGRRVVLVSAARSEAFETAVRSLKGSRTLLANPEAGQVARIGALRIAEGHGVSAIDLEPFYLRRSYAEEKADEKADGQAAGAMSDPAGGATTSKALERAAESKVGMPDNTPGTSRAALGGADL